MIVYGIFDGVGRYDHLVAAAVLSPEDYKEIYGRELDDYYDYLLELEDALYEIEDPVRIVRLPFHLESYREWLAGSSWEDGPEARSAWALEVARNAEELERIRKERPVLPRTPEEERDVVEVLYVPCPLICETEEDINRLPRQLNPDALTELCAKIRDEMPEVPPYNKLSRLRARGAVLMLGDRLVAPGDIHEIESYFTSAFPSPGEDGVIKVPRHFRYKAAADIDTGGLPVLVIAFLPVILRGAQEDVVFLREWLKEKVTPDSAIIEDIQEMLQTAGWEENKIEPPGPFLEIWEVADFLEFLLSGCLDTSPEGEDIGISSSSRNPAANNSQRRKLRRIK